MTIGIIGAMQSEVERLLAAMEDKESVHAAGTDFARGRIAGKNVVVVRCGIGKVCAGAIAQCMIDRFGVSAIVNTGVAGGLDERLEIGDLVVATDAIQHDFDLTAFGYARGYLPSAGEDTGTPSRIVADRELSDRFADAFASAGCRGKVIRGTIVSGDVFVSDQTLKERLIRDFSGAATEMEGAAIAQVCSMNGVPFAVVRAISDLAGKEANVTFDTFEIEAAEQSSRTILRMLEAL